MSMDIYLNVLVGVELEYRIIKTEKTKFNEDTGAPYTIDVNNTCYYIKNTDIEINVSAYKNEYLEERERVFSIYNDYGINKNQHFFGIKIKKNDVHRGNDEKWIKIEDYLKEKDIIRKELNKMGYDGEINTYSFVNYSF